MTTPLRIGTRGSRLALWQANHVADLLRPLVGPRSVEIVEIHTTGDRDRTTALAQIGGQGVFTKEIQQALLDGRADVAVHSLKDLPTQPTPGVVLAAVPPRAADADVFVSRCHLSFDAMPQGARLATGSTRRKAQALHRRPDLMIEELRGNVETRLRKLDEQQLDGIILAKAGLERLGLEKEITETLNGWMIPAVGQGALGLETRENDEESLRLVQQLNDRSSWDAVTAERAYLQALGGGCSLPIAAHADVRGGSVVLRGTILSPDGRIRLLDQIVGAATEAERLGLELADRLLDAGGRQLLGMRG